MTSVPIGWTSASLGDLIELKYGKALPQPRRTGRGFPVFGSNGVVGAHVDALTMGTTLIVGRKGSVGEVNFSASPCSPIDTTYFVDSVPGEQFKFWFYTLRSLALGTLNKSTAIPGLSRSDVYPIRVAVPPLEEQQRIADKLDTVLARVDACRGRLARVAPLLRRFRQSVLAAAASGRLTRDLRDVLASDWITMRADEVCAKVQSGGTPKGGFTETAGIPFLKVYNIVNQRVDFEYRPQFVHLTVHAGELGKSRALPGDVLMNIVGPPLGKIAVLTDAAAEWNINQAISLFRPSKLITSGWLYVLLCEGAAIRNVLDRTKGSVGQVNISLSQCRAFQFPVPSIEEQAEIVRRVETLFAFAERLEARLTKAQTAVDRLTPSLLAKAFRGELVPQDPTDEPAAELLRRLQGDVAEMELAARRPRRRAAAAPKP